MSPYFKDEFIRGFGTWPLKGAELEAAMTAAIETGFRAVDTAQMYQNEADVGRVIAGCGVPRDELLVTTKVTPHNFAEDAFLASVEASAEALGRIDVLLLHWPPADGDVVGPLKLLEQAQKRGLTSAIGVSNFTIAMLKSAVDTIETPLVINQVEFHPFLDQSKLRIAADALGIPLSAYCPIARGRIFGNEVLESVAKAHGKSVAQVTLRWIIQHGVAVNPMSTKPANIAGNFDIMDFELTAAEMAQIDGLNAMNDRIVDNTVVPWAPNWD